MSQKIFNVVVVLGFIATYALLGYMSPASSLGGSSFIETFPIHFAGGLYGGDNKELSVSNAGALTSSATLTGGDLVSSDDLTVTDDATVAGGLLDVTTSNTATSTVKTGCIQTTATSTLTPVKLVLGNVGSAATSTLYNTSSGAVYWAFGTCN